MDIRAFFLSRYDPLRSLYLNKVWDRLSAAQIRWQKQGLNSIAWNLWHIARVEDFSLNRFVADGVQVLDDEQWLPRLRISSRHQGTGQPAEEAANTTRDIDLDALRAYMLAVESRTRRIVAAVEASELAETIQPDRLRLVLFDEGFCHPSAAPALQKGYSGWQRGKMLIHAGLTHSYQHVGEIGVLASLQGADAFGTP
jgi:hypothetical protein